MNSQLVTAIGLASSPIAVCLTDSKPEGALQFKEGGWGCVAAAMVGVSKGRIAAFDRKTCGCPAGGTGLGFGNQYERCHFAIEDLLSTGNPEIAARLQRRSRMAEGERFLRSPEHVRRWLATVPFTEVPADFVVMKPLGLAAEGEEPALVVFLVTPDQLSALVCLSDYGRGSGDSVVAKFGGACQSILFGYAEAQRAQPRGVIGFFDIAQRGRLGRDLLSFTAPYALFREMESNVTGSFLEMEDWQKLRARQDAGDPEPHDRR